MSKSRTVKAYSKPTHYSEFKHMHGHTCRIPEGVEVVFYAITERSNDELIEHCRKICEEKGLELSKIETESVVQDGYLAGSCQPDGIIYKDDN